MTVLEMLGLDEAAVLEQARLMGPAELQRLLDALERVSESVQPPVVTEAKNPIPPIAAHKNRYLSAFRGLIGELQQKEITAKEFNRQARPLIRDAFAGAYKKGVGRELDAGDEEWLRRAVEAEAGHASNLAKDILDGKTARLEQRANHYANALDGVAWNGKVESMPDSVIIHWRLGRAEHCSSCIILACFLTNHLTIDTRRGKILLENVEVGDEVLTHEGRFRRVMAKPVGRSLAGKRCAVLCTVEGLVGITADHPLWTRRGWMTAEEVFHAGERCLPGLRQGDRQAGGSVQELCGEAAGGASNLRAARVGGLQVQGVEEQALRGVLYRREAEDRVASSVALGNEQWKSAVGLPCASQEWGPVGRPAGESGVEETERASFGSHEAGEESVLEGWKTREGDLRDVRARGEPVEDSAGEVLLQGMSSEEQNRESYPSVDVRSLRKGVRTTSLPVESPKTFPAVLLSRLLSEEQVGQGERGDPAVRMLREAYQANKIPDQELEVGQVLLLQELLHEGSLLYDLTVEEDHSFVAAGLIVHNSHSPYTKFSLPTTPRAGDTPCRMSCKCRLEFELGKGAGKPKTGVFGIEAYLGKKDTVPVNKGMSLADWLRPPAPPEGLKTPTGKHRAAVDGMFCEVNYYRRLMAQIDEEMDPEGFLEVAGMRKEANERLIAYMEKHELWDAPPLSVDEAISGKDFPLVAEGEVFGMAVSGNALDVTSAREVQRLIRKFRLKEAK